MEREWLVSALLALEPNFVHAARQLEDSYVSNAEWLPLQARLGRYERYMTLNSP